MRLKNKTVIVTGASSGIGKDAAKLFAAEGAKVVLGARREALLRELAEDIRRAGGEAAFAAGAVEDEGYAQALARLALSRFGGLDAAFNNAGSTGALGPIEAMEQSDWRNAIDVNLTGSFLAAKHQIPALRASGGGSIVFTSSFVGHASGLPGMGAYAAAKAGLIGLTRVLAAELGAENIRVNALLPGGTETAMAGDDPEHLQHIRRLHVLERMARPSEIAQAALFLVSDQSSFVTGSALMADGGNSIKKL